MYVLVMKCLGVQQFSFGDLQAIYLHLLANVGCFSPWGLVLSTCFNNWDPQNNQAPLSQSETSERFSLAYELKFCPWTNADAKSVWGDWKLKRLLPRDTH